MKKLLSLILSLVLIVSVVSMGAFTIIATAPTGTIAESPSNSSESDKTYYTDLFYGYDSSYLSDSALLKLHAKDTSIILDEIYNDYADSDKFLWTQIKSSLAAATSIKEWVDLVASVNGSTDYIFQKALDKANLKLVDELLGKNIPAEIIGEYSGIISDYKKLVAVFDKFENNFDVYTMTEEEVFSGFFVTLKNENIFSHVGTDNITKIEKYVLTDLSGYTKMLTNTGKVLRAAQVLSIGILLENARLEIIDEVIASAPKNSAIYEGMSRLKSQLKDGFESYYITNYLHNELLKEFGEKIVEKIIKSSSDATFGWYEVVTAGIDLASFVVFDLMFNVPSIDDMTTQKVLTEYSSELYNLLKEKATTFNNQFDSIEISKFEAVFNAYIAATNAALDASEQFKLESNKDDLLDVNTVWKDFCYSQYIDNIKKTIDNTPKDERKIKSFDKWSNPNGTFRNSSDTLDIDSTYLFNGAFNVNKTYFTENTTIKYEDGDIAYINGDVYIIDGFTTIPEGTTVKIDGNITVGGSTTKAYLCNKGILICEKDMLFIAYNTNGGFYSPYDNSKLVVKGDLTFESTHGHISYRYITKGTIEFAGTDVQEICLPQAYNIEVTNPKGIKYLASLSLYGTYNLNNNPLDKNGYTTYLYGEESRLDDSDFHGVVIDTDYTLKYNIKGNVYIANGYTTIPEGTTVKIDGNITVGGSTTKAYLCNKGILICEKDMLFIAYNTYGGFYSPYDNSKLVVKGDLTFESEGTHGHISYRYITKGTIEFAGTDVQEICLPQAYNIEISNTSDESVVFTSKISVTNLFNHKGNKFTLYNNGVGSTFIDYDGDGLLDNLDPHPTINKNDHIYDDDYDADCNACDYVREVPSKVVIGDIEIDIMPNEELPIDERIDTKYILGWKNPDGSKYEGTTYSEGIVAEFVETKMMAVKYQLGRDENSIRYIASIDETERYGSVGWLFSLTNENPEIGGADVAQRNSKKVYRSLLAKGEQKLVADIYGDVDYSNFIYVFELTDIPESAADTAIYVRPYVEMIDGTIVYGDVSVQNFNGLKARSK